MSGTPNQAASAAATQQALEAEQIRSFSAQDVPPVLLGALALSLTVWGNADSVPGWTWAPGLLLLYAVSTLRLHLYWRYRQKPEERLPLAWGRAQTLCTAISGACWGQVNAAMYAYLPADQQIFIAAVTSVSASYAAAEGLAYTPPARAFIITSLVPLTLGFYWDGAAGSQLHLTLAVLLTLCTVMLLRQMGRRNHYFIESLRVRFANEFLVRELARQKEISEAAARAKTRFLAAASHDLRQPIQALTFYQELLRPEMTLTPTGQDFFARQLQATQAVSNLLDSLLDIARLDAGTIEVRREPLRLADLLEQLRAEFAPQAQAKGLELRFAGSSALLLSDPILLPRLLRNLLANAVRYTREGKVLLGCRRRGEAVRIEVWDTGIGIAPQHQQAIFGEFYQVQNPERDRQQGLGLGLSIVSRIARRLGTRVEVCSRPGQGSCFAIELPTAPTALAPIREEPQPATAPDLHDRLAVVLENEEMIRDSLRALLSRWGWRVIAGASSQAVLAQLAAQPQSVDLLITDYGLSSKETGLDAMRRLRAQQSRALPVLLITGDTRPKVMQEAQRAGVPILHKPLTPQGLRQALSTLLAE